MLDWIQERPIPSTDRTNKPLPSKRGTLGGIQSSLSGIKRKVTRKSLPNISSQAQISSSASFNAYQQKENKSLHDNKQSTLHHHFTGQGSSVQSNEDLLTDKGDVEMSFASHLNANKGAQHSTLFGSLQSHLSSHSSGKTIGKRRKTDTGDVRSSRTTEEDKEPVKRRRTSQTSFENVLSSSSEDEGRRLYDQPKEHNRELASASATEETQPLAWSSDEEQSIKPKQPSPVQKRKIKPKRRTKSAFAPAISPSKRKTLIEQSAKDCAMQQAKRNQRNALSPIENQCDSKRIGFLDPCSYQSIGALRDKTPSPLRKGFSIVQVGNGDYFSHDEPDSDEEDDLDMLGGPTSPLMSRMMPFSNSLEKKRAQSSPAKTKQRIYAYETQAASQLKSGLGILTEEDSMEMDDNRDNGMETQEGEASNAVGSSQTAPGGSWPGQTRSGDRQTEQEVTDSISRKASVSEANESQRKSSPPFRYEETYMSETPEAGDNIIDETFRLPSSQELPDLRTAVTKRTLRSVSKKRDSNGADKTDAFDTTSSLSDVETQPLAWEDEFAEDPPLKTSKKKASQKHGKQNTPRYSAGWNDLSQVWSGHIDTDKTVAKKRKSQTQSSLNSFGFSRTAKGTQESDIQHAAMSDPENVDSDDELDCLGATLDDEHESQAPPRSSNRLRLDNEGSRATATSLQPKSFTRNRSSSRQSKPVNLSSSQDAMSIPSDSGLDSQLRHFLDEL
ncbi:uncharacterized protein FA14DRAFT_159921 [Meira miltonrushii]|uniref:Uncharacterized protein n=1 Tax=Meira miltonrushii TaxID=1280837 RepID=A0A316VS08_9BASI|nr:uncharacterized protein FA14DRAFT_159921 [Meira miltonrushii]PWN38285.1 hypothetical protein FA14DRAFT_159921 [Meira miltonrushii]